MSKSNGPKVELIPSPAMQAQARRDTVQIEELIKKQVAETLAKRDEFIFEPFFRTRQVAYELRRLQTVPEQEKWSIYFARFGCVACGGRDKGHAGCGFCFRCYALVGGRLRAIVRKRMNGDSA